MRRILAMLKRDVLSVRRDSMALYTLFAVPLLCLALRVFLPGFAQVGADVVVTPTTYEAIGAELRDYVSVDVVDDEDAVRRAVLRMDDKVGITADGAGGYRIVRQGNEPEEARELPELALRAATGGIAAVPQESRDVGDGHNPIVDWAAVFVGLTAIYLATFLMGFGIVEDQEERVSEALGVSPMSRREYVLSRSLLAGVLAVALTLLSITALGATFSVAQLGVLALAGVPLTLLFGFAIASISPTITSAMANFKFVNFIVIGPPIIGFAVPERLEHWVLGWMPTYWAYLAFKEVLFETTTWADLLPEVVATLVMGVVALTLAYPAFRKRLRFAIS